MNKLDSSAAECVERLLAYWKTIELWIKKAEQVNKRAVIPAINELRYASRQLVNAIFILDSGSDTDHSRRRIRRHLTLAEQYLINADHDVADSITTFLSKIVEEVEIGVGRSMMLPHFPQYDEYLALLVDADALIASSREAYTKRTDIYDELRNDIVPKLIKDYKEFKNAEILARYTLDKTAVDARRFTAAARLERWVSGIASVVTIISFVFWAFTFKYSTAGYCTAHPNNDGALSFLCETRIPAKPALTEKVEEKHG